MTVDASVRVIAEKLGPHGYVVVKADEFADLRMRAHLSDAHAAFKQTAIKTIRQIRAATALPTTRSYSDMRRSAHTIADDWLREHDPEGQRRARR